jgi:ComEC/Rec2-related protein
MPLSPGHSEGLDNPAVVRGGPGQVRRPLLGLMLAAVLGLLLGARFPAPLAMLWLGGAAAALLALVTRRDGLGRISVYLLAAVLAWLHADLTARPPSGRELAHVMQREQENLRLLVVADDDPVSEPGRREDSAVWRYPARVVAVQRSGEWRKARGRVEVAWITADPKAEVNYGDRWLLSGPARRLPAAPATAPRVRVDVEGGAAIRVATGEGSWLRAQCLKGRRACARLLALGIEDFPNTVGLTRALMLGYRQELADRAEDAFRSTGTLHIIAISGAHVGMVALFFLVPLKATGCPQTRWILVLGPLLLLYALGTGLSASAVRACIMACTFWAAHLFRRQPDGPSALALAALLILVAVPGQLWEAGFLLSFGVVGGLLVFYPILVRPLHAWIDRDPRPAGEPSGWRRVGRSALRSFSSLLAVTVAAWLVSTPLIASFFHLFSPVALVANLAVVPLAFAMLLAACLSILAGAVHPLGAEIFNHANHVMVSLLLRLVEFFHAWPHGHWFVEAPPRWAIALWLACVAALLLGSIRLRRAAAVVAAIAVTGLAIRHGTDQRVRLETTPLGQATVFFANLPGQADWLVDCGPEWSGHRLVRFLRSHGVDRLDVVVLSRASVRWAGGLPALLDQVPVREVWVPDVPSRSPPFDALLQRVAERGVMVRRVAAGDRGEAAGGTVWEVLHPARGGSFRASDGAALVLRLARGPSSVFCVGHASAATEAEVLGAATDPGAAAVVVAAQDATDSFTETWLRAVQPQEVIRPLRAEDAVNPALIVQRDRLAAAGVRVWDVAEGWVARVTFADPPGDPREPLVRVSIREW